MHKDEYFHGWLIVFFIYLDHLYTFFLLQRALIKHTNTGQEALMDISRQLLSIVIRISSIRDPLVDLDRHFSWIVSFIPQRDSSC